MKCFNCGGKGHPARNCPHKECTNDEPMAGMTLDNGSQVNIVNSKLLTNLCTSCKSYRSMSGRAETNRIGYLEGFLDCQACDDCPTSIISIDGYRLLPSASDIGFFARYADASAIGSCAPLPSAFVDATYLRL
jgi:hypothetical protein